MTPLEKTNSSRWNTYSTKGEPLRITINKDLVLDCRDLLANQGVPLNATQAVSAMLTYAINTKRAELAAGRGNNEPTADD